MKLIKAIMILSIIFISSYSFAETSDPVMISSLRAYLDGSIFVTVQSPIICNTTVFKIDASFPGAKEMYSAAMSAMIAGKTVKLEIYTDTGCEGWGTKLQSLYVLAQ